MPTALDLILKLQKVDVRLDELDAELAHLPRHVAEIEQKLETHKRELALQKEALERTEKERRALEGQVQQLETKASHLETQINEAKTNEQYRAFRSEIAFARKEIQKAEDGVLDKMEIAQAVQDKISTAETALAEEEKVVAKEVEEMKAQFKGDEEERERVRAERAEVASGADPNTIRVYDRVRQKLKGRAVSLVDGDRCTSCHMIVRPNLLQQLRADRSLITCEFCGAILYLPEHVEEPAEDPAGESGIA